MSKPQDFYDDNPVLRQTTWAVMVGNEFVGSYNTPLGRKRAVMKAQRLYPTGTIEIYSRDVVTQYEPWQLEETS